MKRNIKKVLVTVDTEGHAGDDPVGKLILGHTDTGSYGIEKIMDICDEHDAKALFFVDFAEAWDYGVDKIKEVVDVILNRGHDIGVHIHPNHMLDKERSFLWQYTEAEQRHMITECTKLYKRLVGKDPASFRAGKYSANRTTLDILNEIGYQYDFSAYYHQQWCGIDPPLTINAPCKYGMLTEFPVTMHKSFQLAGLSREDKLDVEMMQPGEFRYALSQIKKNNFPQVVTVFFHSFSLLDWFKNPSSPCLNKSKLNKLEKAMQFISESDDFCFIEESDLESIPVLDETTALQSEVVWSSSVIGIYYTYQKAKFIAARNKKAKMLVTAVTFGRAVLCAMVLFLILMLF